MSFKTIYICDECKKERDEQNGENWYSVGYLNGVLYHGCGSECFLNIASRLVAQKEFQED